MNQARFKSGDSVRVKGSSRVFTILAVYFLLECPERAAGFYYSGEFMEDIHEDRLEPMAHGKNTGVKSVQAGTPSKARFSENLRHLIKEREVTFTQLSIGSGVSRSSCYDAAYRGTPTKVSTLVNIAKFFNVSMDDLMFGDMSVGSTLE